jgi:hypothetical protein
MFSFVLCLEDTTRVENSITKDIGLLLANRQLDDILIIDTDESRIDQDLLIYATLKEYEGTATYPAPDRSHNLTWRKQCKPLFSAEEGNAPQSESLPSSLGFGGYRRKGLL